MVYDILDELPTHAGPYLTSYLTITEGEGHEVIYQLNTHCHSGAQHAFRLSSQTPDEVMTLANTSLTDNPCANNLPILPQSAIIKEILWLHRRMGNRPIPSRHSHCNLHQQNHSLNGRSSSRSSETHGMRGHKTQSTTQRRRLCYTTLFSAQRCRSTTTFQSSLSQLDHNGSLLLSDCFSGHRQSSMT